MIRLLNPVKFYQFLVEFIRELINYRFYRKSIDKMNRAGNLSKLGLRVDSLKRVYYVTNLKPETLLYEESEPGSLERFEKQFVAESMHSFNDLFVAANLIEIVRSFYKRIKTADVYGYLVWFNFKFDKIKIWNIIYIISYALLMVLVVKFFYGHRLDIQNDYQSIVTWIKHKLN